MSVSHRHRSWMWLGVFISLGLVTLIAALLWSLLLAPEDASAAASGQLLQTHYELPLQRAPGDGAE